MVVNLKRRFEEQLGLTRRCHRQYELIPGCAFLTRDDMAVSSKHLQEELGAPLYVSETVRYGALDGTQLFIDLRTEGYFALDPDAARSWQKILDADGIVSSVVASIPNSRERSLFLSFVEECVHRGFLTTEPPQPLVRKAPIVAARRPFLVPVAWWYLATTSFSLRHHGFSKTYLRCEGKPARPVPNLATALDEALDAFRIAENFIVLRGAPNDCLPRSLALFRFLLAGGVPARHRIGGIRFPGYRMHAWVDVDSRVLLNSPKDVSEFHVIATIPEEE